MPWSRAVALIACGLMTSVWAPLARESRAQNQAAPKAAESRQVADLSTRFSFRELYTADSAANPGAIGQYRVAIRAVNKESLERAQGAPLQTERTGQWIFTERPAMVSNSGAVVATVRRYEAFRLTPDPQAKPSGPRPLEGLTLWYQPQGQDGPEIVSLTEGRALREGEYGFIRNQIFFPDLAALLPKLPVRVDDSWSLSRDSMRTLLRADPVRGAPLTGKLVEVRQSADGTDWEAVVEVKGVTQLPFGDAPTKVPVNARLIFTFAPPSSDDLGGRNKRDEGTITARGAVTELRLATVVTRVEPQPSGGRLRKTVTREAVIARQLKPGGALLDLPQSPPKATEANSWIVFEDPKGKYQLRHPPEFFVGEETDEHGVMLVRQRARDVDTVDTRFLVKTGDPNVDRLNRDPKGQTEFWKAEWESMGYSVRIGRSEWLPDAEWADSKLKVYRVEMAMKGRNPETKQEERLHSDCYLALTGRDESLSVKATTRDDPSTPFRSQVEAILKTFRFGHNVPK
jgi:hypothetical protein